MANKKFNKRADRRTDKRSGNGKDGKEDKQLKIKENDISWYTKYPTLIGPNASINFNLRYGSKVPTITIGAHTAPSQGVVETTIPGALIYKFLPMYADSADVSSAVNVAAKNLYTYVRHANSGSVNYETSDLMQYLICVMNLYTQIEQFKRDLRIVHTYNAENKYVGRFLLTSMRSAGYTSYLMKNSATLTGYLNVIIGKMNSFKIPKDIAILDRHLWLVSNVFRDDELIKHTQFVAMTNHFAHYDWANQTVQIREQTFGTPDLLLDAINTEIDNLLAYEDVGIMIGDILKAYKNENCRVMAPIQLGEILVPSYSHEIIDQLRNMTIPGRFSNTENQYDILQMTGNSQIIYAQQNRYTRTDGVFTYLTEQIGTPDQNISYHYNQTLVVDEDSPSNEAIILNSRLSLDFECDHTISPREHLVSNYCSELPDAVFVASYNGDPADFNGDEAIPTLDRVFSVYVLGTFSDVDSSVNNLVGFITAINQMHKITGTYGYSVLINYNDTQVGKTLGITNYYSGKNVITMNANWIKRLHDACKLSLWTMPMFKLLEN